MVHAHLEYIGPQWQGIGIDGLGLLTYEERLGRFKLTTLLECRMRGDLIGMFRIVNHHLNYGSGLFNNLSGRLNVAACVQNAKPTKNKTDFFVQRVILFWNHLPYHVLNQIALMYTLSNQN